MSEVFIIAYARLIQFHFTVPQWKNQYSLNGRVDRKWDGTEQKFTSKISLIDKESLDLLWVVQKDYIFSA
jgi:hypothetical protein